MKNKGDILEYSSARPSFSPPHAHAPCLLAQDKDMEVLQAHGGVESLAKKLAPRHQRSLSVFEGGGIRHKSTS